MQVRLGVCLRDPEYAERICCYLNQVQGENLLAVVVRDAETDNETEVLLTDDAALSLRGKTILMQSREKAEEFGWRGERIEPYLPGSRLAIECLLSIERMQREKGMTSRMPYRQKPVEEARDEGLMVGVYSPIGGIGKSTFARMLSEQLALKNPEQKVLYLNMEGISDWRLYYRTTSGLELSDFLYRMLMEPMTMQQAQDCLLEMAEKQPTGPYFVEPCSVFEDLQLLAEEELDQLIDTLIASFSYVVCDLNAAFHGINHKLLERCAYRFFLCGVSASAQVKWENFQDMLRSQHSEDLLSETSSVRVRIGGAGRDLRKGDFVDFPFEKDLEQEKDGMRMFRKNTEWYRRMNPLVRRLQEAKGCVDP